jgi:Uncharacterized conserved protein (DUF2075)
MTAFFSSTVADFLQTDSNAILGALAQGIQVGGFESLISTQTAAWQEQIAILTDQCRVLMDAVPSSADWGLLLEYPIPRRQKRIDTILLAPEAIFVLEFKVGAEAPDRAALMQLEDYCLDLRDFHQESAGHVIVPILIPTLMLATRANESQTVDIELVQPVIATTPKQLASTIIASYASGPPGNQPLIDAQAWDRSAYHPVPTIIEAAEHLFANHDVREIAHAHADVHNLELTTKRIIAAVQDAQTQHKKIICFVTGVPGSGKTLTGLAAVHSTALRSDGQPAGVFLSGNGPLVKIVSAALVKDARTRMKTDEAKRRVSTFIQNVHSFIKAYQNQDPSDLPYEHVVIFDEAQRAWDRAKSMKKFDRNESEPETMFRIMDRHRDWAVIVALVGGGQEIYDGEAGLPEWGKALSEQFPHWEIRVSEEALSGGPSVAGSALFPSGRPTNLTVVEQRDLHLSVSVRSFKAESINLWVNAVLNNGADTAREVASQIADFPILLTRSLKEMRETLQMVTRGSRRNGLVASSGALRLRAHGIEVSSGFCRGYGYAHWFLSPREDYRSSYQLEVAATEFECQGLELDWVGVCWGDDLIRSASGDSWDYRRLRGLKWSNIKDRRNRSYLLNRYRVLLTRAREGVVIWVPKGDSSDPTRDSARLDATADYLLRCGVRRVS